MPTSDLEDRKRNCLTVVLVGGKGTRIRHLLPDLPKPLAPIFGHPFLEWILRFISKQGLKNVALSTGYLAEKVKHFIENTNFKNLDLRCVDESLPLGTAGGVVNAIDGCKYDVETVLVLNGDSLVLASLEPMFDCLREESVDAVLLGVKIDDASRYGTLEVSDKNFLLRFKEKQPGIGLINAGVYLFRKPILDALPRNKAISFEVDVFPNLLEENKCIKVVAVEAPFIDIGTKETLIEADAFIQENFPLL